MSDLTARSKDLLEMHYPERAADHFEPMAVGSTRKSRDDGARLILEGAKTATATADWEWSDSTAPFVGALSVLFDGSDEALAIVETTAVEAMRFGDATEELAKAYGEGERTLAWWRQEIGDYYRRLASDKGERFDDDTVLHVEHIAVLRVFRP